MHLKPWDPKINSEAKCLLIPLQYSHLRIPNQELFDLKIEKSAYRLDFGILNVMPTLETVIKKIDGFLAIGKMDDGSIRELQKQNAIFHRTILENCGNTFVSYTCARISHLPMLEIGSMAFDREVLATKEGVDRSLFRLQLGNSQHKVIFEAIQSGDAVRAEGMMREHSNTMVEYIKIFEKRSEELTIKDLIGFSSLNDSGNTDAADLISSD